MQGPNSRSTDECTSQESRRMFGYIDTWIDRAGRTALVWKNTTRLFWFEMARTRISPCPSPRFSHCSPGSGELIPRVASQFWGIFCWRWRGHGIPCPSPEASHCSPSPGELIPRVASRVWPFFLAVGFHWLHILLSALNGELKPRIASRQTLVVGWHGLHIVSPGVGKLVPWIASRYTYFGVSGGGMVRASHCSSRFGGAGALDRFSVHRFWCFWHGLYIVPPGLGELMPGLPLD